MMTNFPIVAAGVLIGILSFSGCDHVTPVTPEPDAALAACPGSAALFCQRNGECTLPDGGLCEGSAERGFPHDAGIDSGVR